MQNADCSLLLLWTDYEVLHGKFSFILLSDTSRF